MQEDPTILPPTSLIDHHLNKSQLRFLTCGSVDDGKSTLIGRLLYDAKVLKTDEIARLTASSNTGSLSKEGLDFSLLLDGLRAEREQGITIDVAYRFFSTPNRAFVVADCPGHEQYTRNMATGASQCDAAMILVDASKGILPQTRRHTLIVTKLGIKHLVLVVNKMDMVACSQERFDAIAHEFKSFCGTISSAKIEIIPVSGLQGDNVVIASQALAWYQGPTLLDWLENLPIEADMHFSDALRIAVQGVVQDNGDGLRAKQRALLGYVAAGMASEAASIRILPSGRQAKIARILNAQSDCGPIASGLPICFTLDQDVDCGRGSLICAHDDPAPMADAFVVDLIWLAETHFNPNAQYWMKTGIGTYLVSIPSITAQYDVQTGARIPSTSLCANDLGEGIIVAETPIPHEVYSDNHRLGSFILIDRLSNETICAGMIVRTINRKSMNIHWQFTDVDQNMRAEMKQQLPMIVWFTGLSGAGKSTIANLVERRLVEIGHHTYLLEGDNLRYGLNRDLGFSDQDRSENIRRTAEVARLMVDAGLIVIAAFISPFAQDRAFVRSLVPEGRFTEVHVDVSVEEAQNRDPKGIYKRALAGTAIGVTGIDSPYEVPINPEIFIDTQAMTAEQASAIIVRHILAMQNLNNRT